jgi:hypothetical protein
MGQNDNTGNGDNDAQNKANHKPQIEDIVQKLSCNNCF